MNELIAQGLSGKKARNRTNSYDMRYEIEMEAEEKCEELANWLFDQFINKEESQ